MKIGVSAEKASRMGITKGPSLLRGHSVSVSAKISQLSYLPQGLAERHRRALRMIAQMDKEGFGDCSNHGECEGVCPKEISIENISRMRREFIVGAFKEK